VESGGSVSALVEAPEAGRDDLVGAAVFAPAPPPAIPSGALTGGPRTRRLPAPWPDHSGCSPVEVLEDGVRLPAQSADGAWVPVVPADGTDPATNGRAYTLALREDRLCRVANKHYPYTRVWMYPGDAFTAEVALPAVGPPIRGVRAQAAATASPAAGTVHLVLRVAGEVRAEATFPVSGLADEQPMPLSTPLSAADRKAVTVEATLSPDAAPLLLSWFAVED
jgi:hypothetical protein